MRQYLQLVRMIRTQGVPYGDRTGTGCHGIFGHQMRFDLRRGFPLVTTKTTWMKGVVAELLWMLRGETNIKPLVDADVHIWDAWADENGDLGPIYGAQWRRWPGYDRSEVDQLAVLLEGLRNDPFSRRHVISAWNPDDLPIAGLSPQDNVRSMRMALAPCHCLFQFRVWKHKSGRKMLDCQLYQRSADVFLGVPFNIASYALLTYMIAHHLDMTPGTFVWTGGDCHLYSNHLEQVDELLKRVPLPLPSIRLNYPPETPLWEVRPEQIIVTGYQSRGLLKAPVAV